jgi:WD40 repeat protein
VDGESVYYAIALSPDGRAVATGGLDDPLVRVWDVRTRKLISELDQGSATALTLDFSPDGQTLAVSGFEPVASLWDVATGVRIGPTLTAGSRRAEIGLSPDGRRLLLTHADGRGAVWDVDPKSWARRACTLANRTLTREEWEEFLPGRPYEPACAG